LNDIIFFQTIRLGEERRGGVDWERRGEEGRGEVEYYS
jgi:hypothetical protein